ncbi:MAG: hypothetical protein V4608_14895 [Bacteroidota bacterium]
MNGIIIYSKYISDSDFTISNIDDQKEVLIEFDIRNDEAGANINKEKAEKIINHLKQQFGI